MTENQNKSLKFKAVLRAKAGRVAAVILGAQALSSGAMSSGSCETFQPVTYAGGTNNAAQASLGFTTDGTVAYYIVSESLSGLVGKLKMKVTSP